MKTFATIVALCAASFALPALATSHKEAPMMDGKACEATATEKKLAGAAKTSFMKKCEKDAGGMAAAGGNAACEKSAADKKLAGAAKASHIKKCSADMAAKK
jgi:hypothetical protein